jgi:hypothetical protein
MDFRLVVGVVGIVKEQRWTILYCDCDEEFLVSAP